MTNIKYRASSTPTVPTSSTVAGVPLTQLEMDGNFKSISNDIELRAMAGVNSDITQLTGLTTPLSIQQGGTGIYTLGATNDTTPSVSQTKFIQIPPASSPYTITNFLNAVDGQEINILFSDNKVTVLNGTNIRLSSAINFSSNESDVLSLVKSGAWWFEKSRTLNHNSYTYISNINDIGVPGTAGFGVGICPSIPTGYTPLTGCTDKLSANYGNYQYTDGSIMVWIPAFYMRLGHASNPTYATYGVNSISILPLYAFADEATANASSYYLHRAFVNAGSNQLGFFRDKYDCSQNGTIASSIALAMPMVSDPNLVGTPQIGFTGCTANGQTPTNIYAGAIPAAKSRGNKFFPETIFMADALCRISEAHAQAATSTLYCGWYDSTGVRNYPKGNDNNALKSESDVLMYGSAGSVAFTSAGTTTYPNFALTGSGSIFERTTHNGQKCGITDVAGNIYKINIGLTCIATSKNITGASQTNPVSLTVVGHGRTTGDVIQIDNVVGMTQLNGKMYKVTTTGVDTLTLDGVDGTGFSTYTSGGSVTSGVFYTLKPSVDISAVTSGTSTSTDHWGAMGVAAQFDAITPNFATTYPNNGYVQRYGNAANAVFDMSSSNGRALAFAGLPAAAGMSASGSNVMGADYYYQYIRDQLCVISRGNWSYGSYAGTRFRVLSDRRTYASYYVGFAAASYL